MASTAWLGEISGGKAIRRADGNVVLEGGTESIYSLAGLGRSMTARPPISLASVAPAEASAVDVTSYFGIPYQLAAIPGAAGVEVGPLSDVGEGDTIGDGAFPSLPRASNAVPGLFGSSAFPTHSGMQGGPSLTLDGLQASGALFGAGGRPLFSAAVSFANVEFNFDGSLKRKGRQLKFNVKEQQYREQRAASPDLYHYHPAGSTDNKVGGAGGAEGVMAEASVASRFLARPPTAAAAASIRPPPGLSGINFNAAAAATATTTAAASSRRGPAAGGAPSSSSYAAVGRR